MLYCTACHTPSYRSVIYTVLINWI